MKYEVYCDESCLEAIFDKDAHKYAAIGGVWIPAEARTEVKSKLNEIKRKYGYLGELKWNKVTPKTYDMYKEIIEFFFGSYKIKFRAIVIESKDIDNEHFNNSSGEIGFYKFYYQLIHKWLYDDNEYYCFLDHKINGNRRRLKEFHKILNYTTNAKVNNVQAVHSHESVIIQMADVLTGLVSAKYNDEITQDAKKGLISFVESILGREITATGKGEQKFNIFRINLKKGW